MQNVEKKQVYSPSFSHLPLSDNSVIFCNFPRSTSASNIVRNEWHVEALPFYFDENRRAGQKERIRKASTISSLLCSMQFYLVGFNYFPLFPCFNLRG